MFEISSPVIPHAFDRFAKSTLMGKLRGAKRESLDLHRIVEVSGDEATSTQWALKTWEEIGIEDFTRYLTLSYVI